MRRDYSLFGLIFLFFVIFDVALQAPGSSFLSPSSKGLPQYLITMPKKLLNGNNHTIMVEVSQAPTLFRISIPSVNWSREHVLKSQKENVMFSIPSNVKSDSLNISLELRGASTQEAEDLLTFDKFIFSSYIILPVLRLNFIIISETSKPIYKPGEVVQFRFLPVFMPNLQVPTGKSFSMIKVEDPEKTLVYQKINVAWQDAMNLSFQLQPDTILGKWVVSATLDGYTEEHRFEVRKYVLPKFTVDVKVPSHVARSDAFYTMEVCAQYGTGKPMKGIINSHVTFTPYYTSKRTRGVNFTSILDGTESCQRIKVTLLDVLPKSVYERYGEFQAKVEVMEDGTRETVTKNSTASIIEDNALKLHFEGKSYFKRNIPYYFTVKRVTLDDNPAPSSAASKNPLRIEVGNYYQKYQSFLLHPQENGEYKGVFVVNHNQTSVTVYVVEEPLDNKTLTGSRPLRIDHTIHEWKSSGANIQIIQPQESNVLCDDIQGVDVHLTIQSTFPLRDEDVHVQIMSRGGLYSPYIEVADQDTSECEDRDDYMGHFTCLSGQRSNDGVPLIQCRDGYTGANCLSPICPDNCSSHGICANPNQCLCRTGFTGSNCEICIRREGCKNGVCHEGNDCVCKTGYTGYFCDRKATFHDLVFKHNEPSTYSPDKIHPTPSSGSSSESNVLRLNLFERNVVVHIREEMGADIHLIVRVTRDDSKFNFSEIIADSIEIPGMKRCLEKQKNTQESFRFSRDRAEPGTGVTLTLSPPEYTSSHCSLRISDVTLKNFGTSGGVSLNNLVEKLIELNHKITSDGDYKEVNPYTDLYRSNCKTRIGAFYHPYYMPWETQNHDSAKAFESSGLLVLTNLHYMFRECASQVRMYYAAPMGVMESAPNQDRQVVLFDSREFRTMPDYQSAKIQIKARIREFFPETWRFDYLNKPQTSQINLTVPDSMTTWNADAYCMTPQGLWIGKTLSLTVGLPFYIEPSLPYSVKKGETLIVPVKVLSYLPECFEISLSFSNPSEHLHILDAPKKSLCICGENTQETVYFRTRAVLTGRGKVEVYAHSTSSSFCSPEVEGYDGNSNNMFAAQDAVRRDIFVEHEGIPTETVYSEVVCIRPENDEEAHEVWTNSSFKWNDKEMVPGSLRAYIQYGADLIGPTLGNLGKLIQMPYGCGEQNMIAMVPSIYVLDYLSKVGSNTSEELVDTAKRYISIGYNRQLQYQHVDGSFSAFGKNDKFGSTWLTAFVLRSFLDAQKYVGIISETVLNSSRAFLISKQDKAGCFIESGTVLSSGIKGAVRDKKYLEAYLLSAYILVSLKDSNSLPVHQGFMCLENLFQSEEFTLSTLDTYSLAILTYSYATHEPRSPRFQELSSELWKRREMEGSNKIYFSNNGCNQASSCVQRNYASVETTAYAYLALQTRSDLLPIEEKMKVIRWLNGQRNSFGGYYSTQDTIVALKAISQFSEFLSGYSTTNLRVKLSGSGDFTKTDEITEESKLVTRKWKLPLNEEMKSDNIRTSVLTQGSGCMVQQSIFMYNTFDALERSGLQPLKVSERSLNVSPDCKTNVILVCISWNENPSASGSMMLLQVKALSGWTLVKYEPWEGLDSNQPKLQETHEDVWNYYFDGFSDDIQERCLKLSFHQNVQVEDIKPSTIKVTDYYKPEIKHEIFYSFTVCGTTRENITEEVTTVTPTQGPPPVVPVHCTQYNGWNSSISQTMLQSSFYEESCSGAKDFILAIKKREKNNWTFYRVLGSQFVEWDEELFVNNHNVCLSNIPQLEKTIVIAGYSWTLPSPGYPLKLNESRSEVWLAEGLGKLLLLDTTGRCENSVKFARMLKRLKSQLPEIDQSWAPLNITLTELQCPLHVSDDKLTILPQKLRDNLCSVENGRYHIGQVISNVTFNTSSPYQEFQVNLTRSHDIFPVWRVSDWIVTFVLPTYRGDSMKSLARSDSEKCEWFNSAEDLFKQKRQFALLVSEPWKINGNTIFVDGSFAFLDKTLIEGVVSSICSSNGDS